MPGRKMGHGSQAQHGPRKAGPESNSDRLDEFDIADEIHGKNRYQGEDQHRHPNQREAQAGATGDTDELIESFEKIDKNTRAERDAGKRKGGKKRE